MLDHKRNTFMFVFRLFSWFAILTSTLFLSGTSNAYIWPEYGGTIHMPVSSSKLIIDPTRDMSYEELAIFFAMYDCLFRIDEDGYVLSNLASDFTSDDSYKKYKIVIDRRARFHDGTPLTVPDVIVAIQNSIDKLGSRAGALLNIEEMNPASDSELEFVLKESDPDFTRKLAHPFCAVIKGEPVTESFGMLNITHYIGTGAFKISSTSRRSTIRLENNRYYHRGRAYIDAVEFVLIPKTDDSFIEFLMGNLDIHRVSYERYKSLQDRPDIRLFEREGWDTLIIDFGSNGIRKDLIRALDPGGLVNITMNGTASEIAGILPDDEKQHVPLDAFPSTKSIQGNFTVGYYGDRMFLEPVTRSIATKWESKGAKVTMLRLDNDVNTGCDAVLRVVKALGQDSPFLWQSARSGFGVNGEILSPQDIFESPEEMEQKRIILDGQFYPIARLKMVFAVNSRINDLKLVANCVPDFWTLNLK